MNKISGKELNLLKTLEILKSNRFVSFYHFNNLSKREWDTIKQKLRKIETQDIPSNESQGGNKEKKGRTQVLPLSNLLLERTALVSLGTKSNLSLKTVNRTTNSNKDIVHTGVTTKRKLKGFKVELLVLKSKAVVKALYPFLSYSHHCQGVKQTVSTLNPTPAPRINSLINAFHLIEGPTLLVGASTIEGFKESARQLEKEKSLVFVGGVLENQFINHLDLKDCLKTFLPTSANLLQTLNTPLMISPLNYYSNKLVFLLQKRQESFKKEEL